MKQQSTSFNQTEKKTENTIFNEEDELYSNEIFYDYKENNIQDKEIPQSKQINNSVVETYSSNIQLEKQKNVN